MKTQMILLQALSPQVTSLDSSHIPNELTAKICSRCRETVTENANPLYSEECSYVQVALRCDRFDRFLTQVPKWPYIRTLSCGLTLSRVGSIRTAVQVRPPCSDIDNSNHRSKMPSSLQLQLNSSTILQPCFSNASGTRLRRRNRFLQYPKSFRLSAPTSPSTRSFLRLQPPSLMYETFHLRLRISIERLNAFWLHCYLPTGLLRITHLPTGI